uniref:Small ribosomal subunit protein uS14 n=1 Tax=Nothoprocta perdicaria TaxID=30464 RepID=A0A8C6ZXV5_NOTPE
MGHQQLYWSHPRKFGQGSRSCRVCSNRHGLIRKYGLNMCRQCFRQYAKDIGFIKVVPRGRREGRGGFALLSPHELPVLPSSFPAGLSAGRMSPVLGAPAALRQGTRSLVAP